MFIVHGTKENGTNVGFRRIASPLFPFLFPCLSSSYTARSRTSAVGGDKGNHRILGREKKENGKGYKRMRVHKELVVSSKLTSDSSAKN